MEPIKATLIHKEHYEYKIEFIALYKGAKEIIVNKWEKSTRGKRQILTRKNAIWLYNHLRKNGYKLIKET